MSKKKGVSAEEKRIRMLQLFHETKDFYQLKELEKIAPKEKGIIAQSVKDVVQSLVDDGLVDSDKIGTSVYYWAYPSKAKQTKKRQLEDLEEKLTNAEKKLKTNNERIEELKKGRDDTEERRNLLKELEDLRGEKKKLESEVSAYKDRDPEVLEKMKEEIKKAKEGVNRWTDNIFAVKSWCKNKFMIEGDVLDKQFGIPPDLDYVD